MKKKVSKNWIKENKEKLHLLIEESFYFLTALLFLGLIVELILPGLFQLYFNSAFFVFLWLINALFLILYDKK